MRHLLDSALSFLKILVLSLLIVIPLRLFVVQPFFVQGESMDPAFQPFDYLLADEITYQFRSPQRGEVVIFRFPENPSQFYIKRIVGLPGETVEIRDGDVVIYNESYPDGKVLNESSYLPPEQETSGHLTMELEEKEYFVMGDNRDTSYDSRRWGALPKEKIVGRVWLRVWPFSEAHAIEAPQY